MSVKATKHKVVANKRLASIAALPRETLLRRWPPEPRVHDEDTSAPCQARHLTRRVFDATPTFASADFVSCLCEFVCRHQHSSHVSRMSMDFLLPDFAVVHNQCVICSTSCRPSDNIFDVVALTWRMKSLGPRSPLPRSRQLPPSPPSLPRVR